MPRRQITMKDVYIAGLVLAMVYILLENYLTPAMELGIWLFGIFWAYLLILNGLDYYKIMFSFSLSFVSIISVIYIFFIVVLGIPGIPRAIALFLLPLLAVAAIGYIIEKIVKPMKTRRKIHIYVPMSKKIRATLFKLDPIMWVFIIAGSTILIVFLIIPVILMLYHAFEVPPDAPSIFYNFQRIFSAPSRYVRLTPPPGSSFYKDIPLPTGEKIRLITGVNYGILLNSLINATVVTIIATILGIIVAFVLARYDFPGRTLVRILAMIPLFITPFVNAYVISILFGPEGPISAITQALFGYKIWIKGLAGVALAQIMAFYPIVYLNAYSSFINIDPSMEEQAENLGSKGLRLFLTVTLPLALPGIMAGSILVFIFSLEDLGAPIVFQEANLMSYQIYSSFTSETGVVSPEIAALGFVMLFIAAMGFLAIRSYVGMRSYAMISRGGRWVIRERKLGPLGLLAVYLFLVPLILFTAMPQIGVVLLAFNIIPPSGFQIQLDKATPEYFLTIFRDPRIFMYVRNTLIYALMAVAIATIISIMIAYSVSRTKIKVITPALDTLSTIPLAIPGLVIALGYYFFYMTFFPDTPLDPTSGPTMFQAWIVLVIAYSIRKLPFVTRSVFAGFQQVHPALEEAALNLGASRSKVIFGVVMPLIFTYILSGAIIGFIYISTEVSTSITIGGLRPDQAPMTYYMKNVYAGTTVKGVQLAAAMGVLLILFQLIAILVVVLVFKQRYAFIGV